MEIHAEKDPERCLCDDCHNDGCNSNLRAMRIVVGCNDFVNAQGEKNCDIIYSTTT